MTPSATKPADQASIHRAVDEFVTNGRGTRTDAFAQLSQELGMRAGTLAAAYYREARKRTQSGARPEETSMSEAATATAPPDAGPEPDPEDAKTQSRPRRGQLAFDGFAIKSHRLKIAGTTVDLADDEVRELKLGTEVEMRFVARVVKRNNHLLSDDDGNHVEHDVVAIMERVRRADEDE